MKMVILLMIPQVDKMNEKVIKYRDITILIKEDYKYYTLGKHYLSLDYAKAKIDRYWDYDEPSNSVV